MGDALHDPAFAAWYGVLQVQARTTERIAKELESRTGLPASWFELMACLSGCEEGCRMNEVADQLLISRGGATKLVARLEEAGYVRRYTPQDDRRATFAQLTDAGRAAVDAAHPVQASLTHEYFGQYLTVRELRQLTVLSRKVLRGIGADCGWEGWQLAADEAEAELAAEPDAVAGAA